MASRLHEAIASVAEWIGLICYAILASFVCAAVGAPVGYVIAGAGLAQPVGGAAGVVALVYVIAREFRERDRPIEISD